MVPPRHFKGEMRMFELITLILHTLQVALQFAFIAVLVGVFFGNR